MEVVADVAGRLEPTPVVAISHAWVAVPHPVVDRDLPRFTPLQHSLWLANCYFAHDSSGVPVLLPFCNAQSGRSFHSLHLSLPKMLPGANALKSATFKKMKLKPCSQTIRM